jgi:hypothetical protein
VLITHEHADPVKPEYVRWRVDRGSDVVVHSNQVVADLRASHDIEVMTGALDGVSFADVLHEPLPNGATPPNRAYTVEGVLTHPGDSQQIPTSAPLLALPMMAPWTSLTSSVAFAIGLGVQQVFPIHDFFMSASGRAAIAALASGVLEAAGIELVTLDWGESISV